jgi:hypothetical protein
MWHPFFNHMFKLQSLFKQTDLSRDFQRIFVKNIYESDIEHTVSSLSSLEDIAPLDSLDFLSTQSHKVKTNSLMSSTLFTFVWNMQNIEGWIMWSLCSTGSTWEDCSFSNFSKELNFGIHSLCLYVYLGYVFPFYYGVLSVTYILVLLDLLTLFLV